MLGLRHCSRNGGIFQLSFLKCLLKSFWRIKAVLTHWVGFFVSLLSSWRAVEVFAHFLLRNNEERVIWRCVCLNTHPQMMLVLIRPLIQLCSGSRKWTLCLKKVEVVLTSCCHYNCAYLFRNFSPTMKNSIMRQTSYRVNFSPTLLKDDRYFL